MNRWRSETDETLLSNAARDRAAFAVFDERQNCRQVIFFTPTDRNIARGERVRLFGVIPPDCTGVLRARVVLADITYGSNGKPKPAVVGRVTRRIG